jgi:hypothetical protein
MFDGKDSLAVLEFLSGFKEVMQAVGASETLAAAVIPSFLAGPAQQLVRHQSKHFASIIDGLLATYAPEEALLDEWTEIRPFSLAAGETPSSFAIRIQTIAGRLGVHVESPDVRSVFENALGPSLQAALRVQYSTNPALRQKNLTQVARYADNLLLMMKPQIQPR